MFLFMQKKLKYIISLVAGIVLLNVQSAFAGGPQGSSILSNSLTEIMILLMALLLIIIAVIASKLIKMAGIKAKIAKRLKEKQTGTAAALTIFFVLLSSTLFAQGGNTKDAAGATTNTIGGLAPSMFYMMAVVILIEVVIAVALFLQLRFLLTKHEKNLLIAEPELAAKPSLSWWDRFNKLKPVEQEADLDLGHDYDGIRELDNSLPPWWLYGFYLTIIIGVIYFWRYHVSHTAPLSQEEYTRSVKIADLQVEEYLKLKGENINENTVVLLTDKADLDAGKQLFLNGACIGCHGKDASGMVMGQPGVGPNLTDDYWINGGNIKNVFNTIKNGGRSGKGMQACVNTYSAKQIAQLASFVKSLRGSNPPNAKTPDGELYKEEATTPVADSAALKEKKVPVK
jgi:cytochrome c oxidase cbb3-type subunit 3